MLTYPVIIIPDNHEPWHIDGGIRNYIFTGCNSPKPSAANFQIIGFQGTGIVADKIIRNVTEASQVISRATNHSELLNLILGGRGSFAFQIFSTKEQATYFFNDPLGGAPIYRYKGDSCQAFSSDLESLKSAILLWKDRLTPEPKYFAAGHLTGTQSYGAQSPFKEITVLRRGLGAKILQDGSISLFDTLPSSELYLSDIHYEEGLQLLHDEICANILIASDADYDSLFSHLTAGFDSRLVLAAIMHVKKEKDFTFSCIENSSDWDIAKSIAGEFGLAFSSTDGSPKGTGYALNYKESILRTARRSVGAIVSGIDPSLQPTNSLLFQGGYGEVGRTFNSFLWNDETYNTDKLGVLLWQYANYPKPEEQAASIWNKEFLQEVSANAMSYFKEANDLGLERDFFTNYLYVEGRNRHWIGLQSFYASSIRSQFDPLYSRWLVSTPRLLDFESRKSNFLGFDLMKRLEGKLLEYPFDRPRVGWLYEKARGKIDRKEFSGRTPLVIGTSSSLKVKPWPGKVDQPEPIDIERAKAFGLSSLLVHGVRTNMGRTMDLISNESNLLEVYKPDAIARIWNAGNPSSKKDYLTLHNIISSLVLSNLIEE